MNKKEIIQQGINLFNKHFPNDQHPTEKEKTSLVKFFIELYELKEAEIKFYKDCANQYKKSARILQSKVKTYEADINKRLEEVEVQNFENDLNSVKN